MFPKLPDGSRDLDLSWSHIQTWKQMEALPNTKTRAIGVCNYSRKYLEELLHETTIVPAVNQIENHPCLPQNEIVEFCRSRNIAITAYSPLGTTGSPLASDPDVLAIAVKHDKPATTVLLSYHSKSSVAQSPYHASVTKEYIIDNSCRSISRQYCTCQICQTIPD